MTTNRRTFAQGLAVLSLGVAAPALAQAKTVEVAMKQSPKMLFVPGTVTIKAGDTVPIHDRATGEAAPASIFVAVLGASTYTFARAALSQNLSNWIDCHVRSFEFFQGVTRLLVPDNPRTGVTRACRYEPDLNRTYHEMAQHYGIAVLPAVGGNDTPRNTSP